MRWPSLDLHCLRKYLSLSTGLKGLKPPGIHGVHASSYLMPKRTMQWKGLPFQQQIQTFRTDAQRTKRALMQFGDNAGPDQAAQMTGSGCAFAQPVPDLRCPFTESMINWSICRQTENVQIMLHGCATSSGTSLFEWCEHLCPTLCIITRIKILFLRVITWQIHAQLI